MGGHRRQLLPRLHRGIYHCLSKSPHGTSQEWPTYQDGMGRHVVEVSSWRGGWQPSQDPLSGNVLPKKGLAWDYGTGAREMVHWVKPVAAKSTDQGDSWHIFTTRERIDSTLNLFLCLPFILPPRMTKDVSGSIEALHAWNPCSVWRHHQPLHWRRSKGDSSEPVLIWVCPKRC